MPDIIPKQTRQRKFTMQEQEFVRFYCGEANYNGHAAARLAGYKTPRVSAYHVLKRQRVKDAIRVEMAKKRETLEHNQLKSTQLLYDLLDRCRLSEDHASEVAVIRELNAIYGLRTENVKQTGGGLNVVFNKEPEKEEPAPDEKTETEGVVAKIG